jgi:protein arginine N-methyltransferase 5
VSAAKQISSSRLTNSVVTVVGAGRGPLVDCTLRAMQRSGRKARVFAVEKNVSAYVT